MKHLKKYWYWYVLGLIILYFLITNWNKWFGSSDTTGVGSKQVQCKKSSDGSNTGFTTSGYWNPKACNPNN